MLSLILGRLAGFAAPVLAQAVLWLGATCLALAGFAYVQTWRLGESQEAMDLAESQAKAAAASAKATVDVLNAERLASDTKTQDAIEQALAERPADVRTVTRTVERIAREDPKFAACRRPDELHALRVQRLRDVDEANGY